jgi:transcriptional regulator with XRE-family HTH domain
LSDPSALPMEDRMSDVVALLLDDGMPSDRLGELLRRARKRRGWKRRVAAAFAGITATQLRRYERGEEAVPAEVCARLADAYGDDLTAHVPLRVPVHVNDEWLVVGEEARRLPAADPDDVLQAYADVLLRVRRARPGEPVPLRATDLHALAAALAGDEELVAARLVEVLGCSRSEAAQLRAALLRRKVILPVAGLAAGTALLAVAAAGATGDSGPPRGPDGDVPAASTVQDATPVFPDLSQPVVDALTDPAPAVPPVPPAVPAPVRDVTPPTAPPSPAPTLPGELVPDATVPPAEVPPDARPPEPDDPPVSILPGEEFLEIGDAIQEP